MKKSKSTSGWLYAEKWGLLTLVACVLVFGLFLQCGGVFFYDVEDCLEFTKEELEVVKSRVGGFNSVNDCVKAKVEVVEWYRLRMVRDSKKEKELATDSDLLESANARLNAENVVGKQCLDREKALKGRAFISAKELSLMGEKPCLFVAFDNTPATYDLTGDADREYGSGYFPVLERLSDGWVKTVDKLEGAPAGWYTVVYFQSSWLSPKWRDTRFGSFNGHYNVQPNVLELCPIPEDAKNASPP